MIGAQNLSVWQFLSVQMRPTIYSYNEMIVALVPVLDWLIISVLTFEYYIKVRTEELCCYAVTVCRRSFKLADAHSMLIKLCG